MTASKTKMKRWVVNATERRKRIIAEGGAKRDFLLDKDANEALIKLSEMTQKPMVQVISELLTNAGKAADEGKRTMPLPR